MSRKKGLKPNALWLIIYENVVVATLFIIGIILKNAEINVIKH